MINNFLFQAITDEDIQILFTESSSYLIYMTLLYNTGLYEDVVHQYNELTKKFFRHTSPKTFTNLVLASLYQMVRAVLLFLLGSC